MKNLTLLFIAVSLVSCGGGNSGTGVNCPKNSSYNELAKPDNLQLTITDYNNQPMVNVAVQLDQDGDCLLTDSKGHVSFVNLSSARHDVHVFGPKGYDWSSIINIDTSIGYDDYVYLYNNDAADSSITDNPNSYIKMQGAINNAGAGSLINYIYKPEKYNSMYSDNTITSTDYNFKFGYNEPVNTIINSEMWAFESKFDSNTNEMILVDTVHIPVFSSTSTTLNGNTVTKNVDFSLNKPNKSLLAQFDSLTYPTGLSFSMLAFSNYISWRNATQFNYSSYILYQIDGNNVIPNFSYSAYIDPSLPVNTMDFFISAVDPTDNNISWDLSKSIVSGTKNVSIKPTITTIPTIYKNQRGDVIAWNAANISLDYQRVTIRNRKPNATYYWSIDIQGNSNQIRLPKLPDGISPLFTDGEQYDVSLSGRSRYSDPDDANLNIFESFRSIGTWIR